MYHDYEFDYLTSNSALFLDQYWSVIIEKCSSKLEAYTDQKVKGFYYIRSMRWYVHCMQDDAPTSRASTRC